jgi:hypothetical protein
MGETWRSRYPITSFVRQAMLSKCKDAGLSALSAEERILLLTTTFWSATARSQLQAWFRSDIDHRIDDAIHALAQIGAIRLAGIVRAHAQQIARMQDADQFCQIEELLLRSEDEIEDLTARYAARTL